MISPHHSHPTNGVCLEDSMPFEYALCVGQANIYEAAVAIAGGDAFESAQDEYCVWIDCCSETPSTPTPQFTISEVVNDINDFIQSQ